MMALPIRLVAWAGCAASSGPHARRVHGRSGDPGTRAAELAARSDFATALRAADPDWHQKPVNSFNPTALATA
jgi:hypothetical protein